MPTTTSPPVVAPPVQRTEGRRPRWELEEATLRVRSRKSYYRVLYHRLKTRGGPKKAIVAVQHAMLVALWHMLKHGVFRTTIWGTDYVDRRHAERVRRHHIRRLERLGYDVVLAQKTA